MIRVSCVGHARHWFSRSAWAAGGSGDVQPWCVRCGAPNPRCAECGSATHAKARAEPESIVHTMCAQGHHHHASPTVVARQVGAALWRQRRRDWSPT